MATIRLRRVRPENLAAIVPWMDAFNRGEDIVVEPNARDRALGELLARDDLGIAWWLDAGEPADAIGYAIVTYGYDLEFAGRDAFLTELYLAPAARGHGAGHAAVEAIVAAMPALAVRALHLMVRRDNHPACSIYQRAGFREPPRAFLTRRIDP